MQKSKLHFGILNIPVTVILILIIHTNVAGQDTLKFDPRATDTDPTKPVFLSLRYQFVKINEQAYNNLLILRHDMIALKKLAINPNRSRGIITRFDFPLVAASNNSSTITGIGDLYAQALVAPRIQSNFFTAAGIGLVIPTATNSLGREKFIVAPALVPVLFFPGRGLAFLKFQDWISFAGSGENDYHYFTVTFSTLLRIIKKFWVVIDSESNTDWLNNNNTWYKSGFLGGYMISRRVGSWVKGEIPYGQYHTGEWYLTIGIFVTRF